MFLFACVCVCAYVRFYFFFLNVLTSFCSALCSFCLTPPPLLWATCRMTRIGNTLSGVTGLRSVWWTLAMSSPSLLTPGSRCMHGRSGSPSHCILPSPTLPLLLPLCPHLSSSTLLPPSTPLTSRRLVQLIRHGFFFHNETNTSTCMF